MFLKNEMRDRNMARIIYQDAFDREELEGEIDFNQALRILKGFMGTEDTLDALKGFEKRYEKKEREIFESEDEYYCWYRDWKYEIFSYNLLVEGFSKLFAPK
jgi:hypothetical protein